MADLTLFNSLTRTIELFAGPRDAKTVRIYTCGPTVYAYQHIGNMRAFLFADTLGRVLRWNGFATKHIINITDVGHLTSDADAGDDKMEKAAAAAQKSIWDIAAHYTAAFKADVRRLNIAEPAEWTVATDHIPQMIEFAKTIEQRGFTYPLGEDEAPGAAGLYFDVNKLGGNYGKLARTQTEAAGTDITEGRIELVEWKRSVADFALWRNTPPGENRQMEWDSPWGKGAPGWHLECSVMSLQHLGHPFDIHTGGIDHREIHHPNEIAQNQAYCGCADTGAAVWMHNNFLIDRRGKMSKSSGDFLRLDTLIARGVHPLAYRLMCLSAHYRSELEFTWEGLGAALTRLKRLVQGIESLTQRAGGERKGDTQPYRLRFAEALGDDLNTAKALTVLDEMLADKKLSADTRLAALDDFDAALGLGLPSLTRADLRVRPDGATIDEGTIEARLAERKEARAAKDFARSDTIRDELAAQGVEAMDGDPLGWDWKLEL